MIIQQYNTAIPHLNHSLTIMIFSHLRTVPGIPIPYALVILYMIYLIDDFTALNKLCDLLYGNDIILVTPL